MSLQTPQIPLSATETVKFSLSAYPQMTNVHLSPGHYGNFGRLNWQKVVNLKLTPTEDNQILIIEGHSLSYTDNVYLSSQTSASPYLTSITGVSAISPFLTAANLSALFPTFSGMNINNFISGGSVADGGFKIIDDNHLEVTLPKLENSGKLDIIIVNGAGWNSLQNSLSTILNIYG